MKIKILLKIGLMAMCLMAGFVEMEAQELFQKEYSFSNANWRIRHLFPSTIIQTRDSGFASINLSPHEKSPWVFIPGGRLLKINREGNVEWCRFFKTIADSEDVYPNSVIQARDGSFYICGVTTENYRFIPFLLKTDKNGNKLWIKSYTVSSGYNVRFLTLAESPDGSVFIAGRNQLCKVDSGGNLLWTKRYSKDFNVIKKATDSTFILAGSGLAEIDTSGNILWAKDYGEGTGLYVKPLKNGGYITTANRGSAILKTGDHGEVQWTRAFSGGNIAGSGGIEELQSGNLAVCGAIDGGNGALYGWFLILDSAGGLVIAKRPQYSKGMTIFSIHATSDTSFVAETCLENSYQSSSLLKINNYGITSCPKNERIINLTEENYTPKVTIPQITDTLIQITATDLPCEFLSVDVTATDICAPTDILEENETGDFQLYPNPASGICTILLKEDIQNADVAIIDINGKTLHRKFLKIAEGEIMLDISPLQPGVYFVKVIVDGREIVRKMIVE